MTTQNDTECLATLHHGPGHQSKTLCRITGVHEIHEAVVGDRSAWWKGDEVSSGYFDEFPCLDEE